MQNQPTVELQITASCENAIANINRMRDAFAEATKALQELKATYAKLPWLVRCALRLQVLWDFGKGGTTC